MKKQIVFIHGGYSFSNYEKFLDNLKTEPIWDPYGIETKKRWKETLKEEFSMICDIFYPSMPNRENAHYIEWKIWFERYFEFLTGEVILVGHSQGGCFLAKYLSENTVPFPVIGLYLVAVPCSSQNLGNEDIGDFQFDQKNLSGLEKMAQNITIYHSTDDDVVPYSHGENYHKALSGSSFTSFANRGHFLQSEFPEIITSIRALL
jgi:predicted alpha/beta hydrolase family esterase